MNKIDKKAEATKSGGKRKFPFSDSFKDFWSTVRGVHLPSFSDWLSTFWRVLLIVSIVAAVITALDYGLIQGAFGLQGILPPIGDSDKIAYGYLGTLVFFGLLSIIGVLFQQGSSDGLTSLLGSGSQYKSSIAGAAKRISTFTLVVGVIFGVLCLFSPMFLEGLI